MTAEQLLRQGKAAFQQQLWQEAYSYLSNADKAAELEPTDLEWLAIAAYLTGNTNECIETWTRAHSHFLAKNEFENAIRCAFWVGFILSNKGELARGGGWIARAHSLLEESQLESAQKGYLHLPEGLRSLHDNNGKKAYDAFNEAGKVGEAYGDRILMTLSRLGRGQALIQLDKIKEGVALLDEAMAAIDSGETTPIVTGIVYCAVIETCLDIFDLNRAQEWTEALSEWCDSHPSMVPYRGQCLIRRSEIKQLQGAWPKAIEEAHRASELLTKSKGEHTTGAAFYQLGELYRLQGDFSKAEEMYSQANKWGQETQPGLALLKLSQAKHDAAETTINHALEEAITQKKRARFLPGFIEIMLSLNYIERARKAVNELVTIAHDFEFPYLLAIAQKWESAVLLAEGNITTALEHLRKAKLAWEKLQVPYETAQIRMLIGKAYHQTGDYDSAEMEFEAARWTFEQLDALPDLTHLNEWLKPHEQKSTHGLSSRELQVLQLIANGNSNKTIAQDLSISERTVERHVSNIFNKLNVNSRTAITAYAYRHHLL